MGEQVWSGAGSLIKFNHPGNVLYVSGPEDGSLDAGVPLPVPPFRRYPDAALRQLGRRLDDALRPARHAGPGWTGQAQRDIERRLRRARPYDRRGRRYLGQLNGNGQVAWIRPRRAR